MKKKPGFRKILFKTLRIPVSTVLFSLLCALFCFQPETPCIPELPGTTEISRVSDTVHAASYKITPKELDHFFGQSAVIGNSIGLGFKRFLDSKEKGYLGGPTMLVQGSYSFIIEFTNNKPFMLHYRGRAMKAMDAVQLSGVKHVFINMGVNDFNTSKDQIFSNYKKYIKEIRTKNPTVDFYILATTPAWKPKGRINNQEIDKLNRNMLQYAKKTKNTYYIDINTPLKGADGRLKESAVSDGFIHLNRTSYEIWVKYMKKFIRSKLKAEKKAKFLVKAAKKNPTEQNYQNARTAVKALEKSSLKDKLKKKLHSIKIPHAEHSL